MGAEEFKEYDQNGGWSEEEENDDDIEIGSFTFGKLIMFYK